LGTKSEKKEGIQKREITLRISGTSRVEGLVGEKRPLVGRKTCLKVKFSERGGKIQS